MTYAKNSTITAIHRPITNGMYNDTYTVIYSNGIRRNYTIKGAMNKKHFEFIQSATVESRYSKHTGKHTADIFTAPAEPKEEPTTEELTKANNEEATQEDETMRFKKDYFKATSRKIEKYNCIRFDADIEFYVTNCTEEQEPAAIRKAVEKFVEELKKSENMNILVDSLEMMLNFNEYDEKCTFNEIRNGGNAYEIEINRGGDNDLFIYIRICEHQDAPEEPKPEEEASKNYIAWCGMIDNDVITDEFETLSEVVDEVETKYNKDEMKAAGITFCKLLCNSGQWLECLEEKKVDDVYYF